MPAQVSLNLRVPAELKARFGAACTARDKEMTEVLIEQMELFIGQTAGHPKAGPRYRAGLVAVGMRDPEQPGPAGEPGFAGNPKPPKAK